MHKRLPFWLVLFAVGAMASLHAQAPAAAAPAAPAPAALPPGQIKAAKVTGTASVTINGATKSLNTNDDVPEQATVVTGKDTNSSVVLVFSNGATTQLGADSSLEIQQFLQEPFSANVVVANLDAEPTISKTRLHLNKGELVGNVKHLNHGSGSTFVVNTPVGAAGIRGTTFKIVFRPNGTGLAFFSLSTVEGNVNFQQPGANGQGGNAGQGAGGNQPGGNQGGGNQPGGNNGGGGPGGGNPPGGGAGNGGGGTNGLPVTGGNEVVITVTVNTNPTTGVSTVTVAPPVVTTTSSISAATLAQVTQQAVTIATTAATVTFTPPTQTGGGGSGGSGNSGGGNSGGNSSGNSSDGSGGTGNGNASGSGGTSGNSSGSGSGSGGGTSNSGSGNGNSSGSTGNSSNQNSGASNFTNPSPPIVPSTPRVTTGDGKSG